MQSTVFIGDIVLEDKIISDGIIVVENGIIKQITKDLNLKQFDRVFDYKGYYVAPGFIDIHCHACENYFAYENPIKMANYHLKHGTTTLLCTLYRDLSYNKTVEALDLIKKSQQKAKNIFGVHLEGPYINAAYGSKKNKQDFVNEKIYKSYIESGIIKQWTFSPELENTDIFLSDILKAGIIPAIGHSDASPQRVFEVAAKGVKIVTHLTNATGTNVTPTRYIGTKEVSFDEAAMLCNNLFYEIICDSGGVHIRPEMIQLIIKTVGLDRIVGITDRFIGSTDDSDVNIINGELTGSKLTMDKVAKNFKNLGLSVVEVFKVVSLNPARALGIDRTVGSIAKGKKAKFVIVDKDFNIRNVYCQ